MLLSLKIRVKKEVRMPLLIMAATLLFTFNALGQERSLNMVRKDYIDMTGYKYRVASPRFAIKTNLLYGGAALTPNLGFEFGVGPKSTIELTGSYSWLGLTTPPSDNHKQLAHMIARPEYRWWFCERYNGHFLGLNLMYTRYNVSGINLPLLFEEENRYDGYGAGAGVTYGYDWGFGKRWNIEFFLGVGYMYMDYDKYTCVKCDRTGVNNNKHYVGPTRIGISLMYLFK